MFSIHFVYICLHFLNIYFNDSVWFKDCPDNIHIEQGHYLLYHFDY